MANSKSVGYAFRQTVALALQAYQVPVTVRRERHRTDHTTGPHDALGDLQGLADWAILTRAEQTRDLSGGLDEARRAADADHKPRYAALWSRSGRDVGEAFVVLDLKTFAALLRETATFIDEEAAK